MIPQLKSIFNQNQLTSLVNLLTQTVNSLIAGKEDVANKQNSLAADVTNTKYPTVTAVNTGLALKLNLTGGTMSGAIAMGTNKITGLGTPTANQDAATKLYVDNSVGPIPTLNQVLTTGNTSQLNASIRTLGLFDPTYVNYGNVSLNNNVFIITNSFSTQILKMQDTVFSLGYHYNTKTVNLESNLLSANRTFAFPDIDGTFAMTSYADTAAATAGGIAQANANAYTDIAVATKQNLFDYSGAATASSSVTIDNKKGGVATFTRVIPAKDYRILTLNSNLIFSTSKIIPVLVYKDTGAGFPVILNQFVIAGKVDFIVANLDADGSGGLDTNDSLLIQYQIVG
jgi:hypothetical protein